MTQYKVLIYCHPHKVFWINNTLYGHWMAPLMQQIILQMIEKKTDNVIIKTVDIIKGGDFNEDAFHENFYKKHCNEYDLIFLPDCAGEWYYLQCNYEEDYVIHLKHDNYCYKSPDELKEMFLNIIKNVDSMLKNGGRLYISKFIQTGFYESTYDLLLSMQYINDLFINPISNDKFIYALKNMSL
jgi:hypothetical protein